MKPRYYQRMIFPKEINDIQNNIFKAIEPKLTSIDFLMLYNLLPCKNEYCKLCSREFESIDHLFFHCSET